VSETPEPDDKPKGIPLLLFIPMIVGALVMSQVFSNRFSVMLGFAETNMLGTALDGAIGATVGGFMGFGIGLWLTKLLSK
jgi:hypothetical protein